MIRPDYIDVDINESKDDVALYNIKLSDEYKNIETMIYSFMGWFKNDDSRNFQDLEKLLRDNDLDTHLIAKYYDKQNIPENSTISIPNNNEKNKINNYFEYIVMISCREKEDAIKEVKTFADTYQVNFNRLEKTGSIFKTNELLENAKDENIKDIINCTKKYKFIKYNNVEALGYMISDLKNQFGTEPTKVIVGKKDGKELYGLMVDGIVRSPIVYCHTDDEKKIDLIDLRQYGRMKNPENNSIQLNN
jgi:hypothetical protein